MEMEGVVSDFCVRIEIENLSDAEEMREENLFCQLKVARQLLGA
jgi:hypothetical protein